MSLGTVVRNWVSHVVRLALMVHWSGMDSLMSLFLVDWVLDVANRGVSLFDLVAHVWALNVMRLWSFVVHWSSVMWSLMMDGSGVVWSLVMDGSGVVWSLVVDWGSML